MYGSMLYSRIGPAGCCVWTELYPRMQGWRFAVALHFWKAKGTEKKRKERYARVIRVLVS